MGSSWALSEITFINMKDLFPQFFAVDQTATQSFPPNLSFEQAFNFAKQVTEKYNMFTSFNPGSTLVLREEFGDDEYNVHVHITKFGPAVAITNL